MTTFAHIAVSMLPVVAFLAGLIALDSYKLVKLKSVALTIVIGGVTAFASLYANELLVMVVDVEVGTFKRYLAPSVEEIIKALWVIALIRGRKIGFMVDAAIFGFAVGAGFALIENVYYLKAVPDSGVALWIVRGFGTAIMHGGATAMFAVITKELTFSRGSGRALLYLPGLLVATLSHSLYNHFILPPMISTLVVLIVQPALLTIIFSYSEKSLQSWLGHGMDAELELYDIITKGEISDSHLGKYLETLKGKFPGAVVADMLCYLRIHLELALASKGFLMMRQAGHKTEVDPEIRAQFDEMKFLEKSIGPTGKLAIAPIVQTSDRDLWQIYMLRD
ncbi:MAG TPA: PrsW family glutamic-type intramembrane protease [candidate division Zixibacteria bacterium]|nr:PrsW family glutamic-type intramembrane protease [candidate division Zixibacteria bacterium]